MTLLTTPDIYNPIINSEGNYEDYIPRLNIIENGLICPCGTRKDKVYLTISQFNSHIKSKNHKSWLEVLNNNKTNFYKLAEKKQKIINTQKLIIAKLDIELQTKTSIINDLTKQLALINVNNNKIEQDDEYEIYKEDEIIT